MASEGGGSGFVAELRQFLAFLQSLWGLLAGTSVFFPLSNSLVGLVPLQEFDSDGGALYFLSPEFVTAMATVATLFVVLTTFAGRRRLTNAVRRAWMAFGIGTVSLVAYLVLYVFAGEYSYPLFDWESEEPVHLLVDIPLAVLYAVFFASITRAFMLMAMLEYYSK